MSTPDSAAWEGQRSEVRATRERDNPQYGAVELLLHTSETSSTSVRITRATAEILRDQLSAHLGIPEPAEVQERQEEQRANNECAWCDRCSTGTALAATGGRWLSCGEPGHGTSYIPHQQP